MKVRSSFLALPLILLIVGFSSAVWSAANEKQILESCPMIEGVKVIGMAIDPKSQAFLYCEYHFHVDTSPKTIRVAYAQGKEEPFAEKRLSWPIEAASPNVYQEDFRHGDVRVVSLSDDKALWDTRHQKANGGRLKERQVQRSADTASGQSYPVVIDSGVNEFILDNAEELLAGNHQNVHFLSPIHGRFLRLKLRKSSRKSCGGLTYDRDNSHCLLVEPQNLFLRLLVEPIALVYDQQMTRLQSYSGIVNITNDSGKDLTATIYYHYL